MAYTDEFPVILKSLGSEMKDVFAAIQQSFSLLPGASPGSPQDVQLRQCRTGVHRAMRLVDDVLLLANGVAIEPGLMSFSPAERIATICEVLEPLARRAGVSLDTDFFREMSTIDGDVAVFDQIVTRLIEYAIRAADRGKVCLSLKYAGEDRDKTLWMCVAVANPRPEVHEDDVSLSLARILTSRMGGKLDHARLGASVIVQMFLPVRLSEPHEQQGSRAEANVLIAEDSDDSYRILFACLRDQPCSVTRALDGEEAAALAIAGDHDIVFMDVNMPKLDGYAATRRIRNWETAHRRRPVPIIILSANPIAGQLREGAIAGCSGYLEKPVRRSLLIRTLNQYLDQSSVSMSSVGA